MAGRVLGQQALNKQLEESRRRWRRDRDIVQALPDEFFEMVERRYGHMNVTAADNSFKAGTLYGRLTVFSELTGLRTASIEEISDE